MKICPCTYIYIGAAVLLLIAGMTRNQRCSANRTTLCGGGNPKDPNSGKATCRTGNDLRRILAPLAYEVTQKKGTELAFSGRYHDFKGKGTYACVCCGKELFSSDAKYDSGSGWPSFWQPMDANSVATSVDKSGGMLRTEAICSRCRAHLGHVFDDGPQPTGLRYCINSASLDFTGDANMQQPPDANK